MLSLYNKAGVEESNTYSYFAALETLEIASLIFFSIGANPASLFSAISFCAAA